MTDLIAEFLLRDLRQMGVEVELASGELSPVQIHLRFPPGASEGFIDATRAVVRPHCDKILQILLEEGEAPAGDARAGRGRTGGGHPGQGGQP